MAFILKKDRTRTPIKQNISQLLVRIMIKTTDILFKKKTKNIILLFVYLMLVEHVHSSQE